VGDAVQSIYSFRHARVDLFLRVAAEKHFGPLPIELLNLSVNFRSQADLVRWCNETFSTVFPSNAEARSGQAGFQPAEAIHPGSGDTVQLHPLIANNAELEARAVAAVVAAERTVSPSATIAILVHNRKHATALLPALAARGLHPQGVQLAALALSPVAADVLALAQALLDPADRVAWLALLRAPWCGLTLADLHALCHGDSDSTVAGLWAARRDQLSADGQARAQRLLDVVLAAAAQRGRVPLRALVAWCWRELGGDACAAPSANPADAETVFSQLDLAGRTPGGLEPARLEANLLGLYAPPDPRADARLQIMTVHQAKGLEFDVVLLPSLARRLRPDAPRLLEWMESSAPPRQAFSLSQILLAARAPRSEDNPHLRFLSDRRQRQTQQEQLRLLYVAATRARQRLHLFAGLPPRLGGDPHPDARTPLARIWPAVGAPFLAPLRPFLQQPPLAAPAIAAAVQVLAAPAPTLRRVRSEWTPPVPAALAWRPPSSPLPPSAQPALLHVAGALARRIGIAVHAMLQAIADRQPLAWDPHRLDFLLRQAGIAAPDLPAAHAQAAAALDRTLADERGRWILVPHEDAHTEWALTSLAAGSPRPAVIDRSFIADGIRWIIDYKLATHQGSSLDTFLDREQRRYLPQLAAYASNLAPLSPHPIRCGLYFPLLSAWRQWQP
ncbi:MAG: 3'-5' exonuclease, partial [Terriglobales bacterium]